MLEGHPYSYHDPWNQEVSPISGVSHQHASQWNQSPGYTSGQVTIHPNPLLCPNLDGTIPWVARLILLTQ